MKKSVKKQLDKVIKENPKNKYFVIPRPTITSYEKFNKLVNSLVKNSLFHYEMLIALQQQVLCLEAKIKILEEINRRRN